MRAESAIMGSPESPAACSRQQNEPEARLKRVVASAAGSQDSQGAKLGVSPQTSRIFASKRAKTAAGGGPGEAAMKSSVSASRR